MDKPFVVISLELAQKGREFNAGILKRFRDYFPENAGASAHSEHTRLIKCAAQTFSWLQPRVDDDVAEAMKLVRFYHGLMMTVRVERTKMSDSKVDTFVRQQINGLRTRSRHSRRSPKPMKPVRTEGVIAGLQTWAKVKLPDVQTSGLMCLRDVQENVLEASNRISWTTVAPMKLYALDRPQLSRDWPERPDPDKKQRECYMPIGRRVSASIQQLFGIKLGESEKDHQTAQQLQVRMKEWANQGMHLDDKDTERFTLPDINSGLQAMRSINERGTITYH